MKKEKWNLKNNQRLAGPSSLIFNPREFQKYLGQKLTHIDARATQGYTEKYLMLTLILQRNTKGWNGSVTLGVCCGQCVNKKCATPNVVN